MIGGDWSKGGDVSNRALLNDLADMLVLIQHYSVHTSMSLLAYPPSQRILPIYFSQATPDPEPRNPE